MVDMVRVVAYASCVFMCSCVHVICPIPPARPAPQDCVLTECNVASGVVIDEGSKLAGEFLTLEEEDDGDKDEEYAEA